jgi:hypothetical protein
MPIRKPNTINDIVDKLVLSENGCRDWPMSLVTGYGQVCYQGYPRLVHKLLFEHQCGPVPEGKELHHMCGNRACAEMSHVQVVTHREHMLLGNLLTSKNAKQTHCPQGHEYTEENTYVDSKRRRHCRTCHRNRAYFSYYAKE